MESSSFQVSGNPLKCHNLRNELWKYFPAGISVWKITEEPRNLPYASPAPVTALFLSPFQTCGPAKPLFELEAVNAGWLIMRTCAAGVWKEKLLSVTWNLLTPCNNKRRAMSALRMSQVLIIWLQVKSGLQEFFCSDCAMELEINPIPSQHSGHTHTQKDY